MQSHLHVWIILVARFPGVLSEGAMVIQFDTVYGPKHISYLPRPATESATKFLPDICNQTGYAQLRMQSPASYSMPNPGGFDREGARRQLFKSLEVSADQRRYLEQLSQGSDEWKVARKNRLTGSNFGAAVGHNQYTSPKKLVHEMLYGCFDGNEATRWGSAHEAIACHEYTISRRSMISKDVGHSEFQFEVTHSGLNVCLELPWLAVSPDGHVHERGLNGILEIKCPFSKKIYNAIPPYYMDQVQGIMGVLGAQWADFCIWTPGEMCIQRVHTDRRYWEVHLLPALKRFYHDLFVPAYIAREERRHCGDFSVPAAPP